MTLAICFIAYIAAVSLILMAWKRICSANARYDGEQG